MARAFSCLAVSVATFHGRILAGLVVHSRRRKLPPYALSHRVSLCSGRLGVSNVFSRDGILGIPLQRLTPSCPRTRKDHTLYVASVVFLRPPTWRSRAHAWGHPTTGYSIGLLLSPAPHSLPASPMNIMTARLHIRARLHLHIVGLDCATPLPIRGPRRWVGVLSPWPSATSRDVRACRGSVARDRSPF